MEYLVKWTGHPAYDATWEPLIHLENARDAVSQFELEKGRIMIIRCVKCGECSETWEEGKMGDYQQQGEPPGHPTSFRREGDVTIRWSATLDDHQPPSGQTDFSDIGKTYNALETA